MFDWVLNTSLRPVSWNELNGPAFFSYDRLLHRYLFDTFLTGDFQGQSQIGASV